MALLLSCLEKMIWIFSVTTSKSFLACAATDLIPRGDNLVGQSSAAGQGAAHSVLNIFHKSEDSASLSPHQTTKQYADQGGYVQLISPSLTIDTTE